MNKKNWLVIGVMALLVVVAAVAAFLLPGARVDEDCVIITVAGEEYARIPLTEPQTLTIRQENGAVNVAEVSENGMRMVSSTCPGQDCVHQGWVTLDTWELLGGSTIICMHNGVYLELAEAGDGSKPAAESTPAASPEGTEAPAVPPEETPIPEATALPTDPPTEPPAVFGTEKSTGYGLYFDTVVQITLYGAPEGLMEEVMAACEYYENLLSKTVEGSDVWRINHAEGQPTAVDPETWEILRRAGEISTASGGAFSITIAPISALWDFTGGTRRMPTADELAAALPLVDDAAILLGEGYTVTLPAGVQIDLGGIAKGYIADKLAELLRGRCLGALISLGGNTYAVGDKPDGSYSVIGIQDPTSATGTIWGVVFVKNTSVVTSGTYERGFAGDDGQWYHHILDPKTGLSAETDLVSATVIMDSSMTADALATAFIVLGAEEALRLAEDMGVDAAFITASGQLILTSSFQAKYGYMPYADYLAALRAAQQ